ncbi:hypothetical protein [uncultured Pseudokineococcus sp.]|uniref:hypothetical protein n=1 Tax=uncultured Pseudokineococcus sp. TaxID=1642928 RepID=UPI002634C3A7|nr:hypothetical protein [uncultured Pseudokineococcus sp.]
MRRRTRRPAHPSASQPAAAAAGQLLEDVPGEQAAGPGGRRRPQPVRRGAAATPRGFAGVAGGRWNTLPLPHEWRGTTVQVCGLWPMVAGSNRPTVGVPLGPDLQTGTTVSADPLTWFEVGFIANPSALILGRPGLGKSTTAVRMILGLAARGVVPMALGDLKPDYADTIRALGGTVISYGRSRGQMNVLDLGAMVEAADQIGGAEGAKLRQDAVDRSLEMVAALITVVRRLPVTDHEEMLLAAAIDLLLSRRDPTGPAPILPDLIALIDEGPEPLMLAALARGDARAYRTLADPLQKSLQSVVAGPLGSTFAGPTTTRIRLDTPGVCVDISALGERDERLTAAVMLATWAEGFAAMEAAQALADAGLAPRRKYLVVMDELWRPLRIGAGLPDRMDAITRLNRSMGVGQIMLTHTLKDMESMANEADRVKARGFAERAGMVITAGLPRRELTALSDVVALTEPEIAMVSGWNTPKSWTPPRRTNGRPAAPPGAGKMLIKVGERAGVPVKVDVTETELALHDTNSRWHDHHLPPAPLLEPADALVDEDPPDLDDTRGDGQALEPAGTRGSGW